MFHIHFLLRLLIKKQIKKKKNHFVDYSEAKDIGIIFEYIPEEYAIVENFIQILKEDQKQVSILAFVSSKNKKKNYPNIPFFQSRDISFWGNPHIKELHNFINTKFDYLLHISTHSHILIDYILAKSNAKCKIGKYKTGREELYQFMLLFEKEKKYDIFLEYLYSNLKKIKTN